MCCLARETYLGCRILCRAKEHRLHLDDLMRAWFTSAALYTYYWVEVRFEDESMHQCRK